MRKIKDLKYLNDALTDIKESWIKLLTGENLVDTLFEIDNFLLQEEKQGKTIYPQKKLIFNFLKYSNVSDIKVVIIGQDPYHGPQQAMGLSFSVNHNVKIPPSLRNIYKELSQDLNYKIPATGDLTCWAKQDVLLLNSILTVEAGTPGSHAKIGWDNITDAIIELIDKINEGCVFILWGSFARKKASRININKHLILESAHPSPLSAHKGFFGNGHFSKANMWIRDKYGKEINWNCIR